MPVTSDDELLTAWRAGNKRAGKQLFERHYNAVDRFFRNKVDSNEAADLAQRTFLGCLESVEAERYADHGNFRGWLFAIAYRQLCKYYRAAARERARVDPHAVSVDGRGRFDLGALSAHALNPTPSSVVARSEEGRLLLNGLRQIPIDLQVVLELRYWEHMSDQEIARALGQPLGTTKSRLRRARQLLAERLGELAHTPAQLQSTLANLDGWAERLRELALGSES